MVFSADLHGVLPRVSAVCRLLMQVRLLLVGITLLLLAGSEFTVSATVALAAAAFSSWLGAHYSRRIVDVVLRHPILLGLDVVVSFAVLEFGGPLGPYFLFTVVTAAVAGMLFRWRGVAYFCSLQMLCYLAILGTTGDPAAWTFQALVGQPIYYPLVGFVGVRVRRLLDDHASMAEKRRQTEVVAAAADERARLARDLHDSLAKTLRGIAMSAKALPMWVDRSPERAAGEAERMASAAEIASREARDLIADLRTAELDRPLDESIGRVAESWAQETGTSVCVDASGPVELPVLARYEATAILKETLTNIDRHAGAGHVNVKLTCERECWILSVHDDGRGFEPANPPGAGHFGLVGMHERAARAGAALSLTSSPGEGTTVQVAFPMESSGGSTAAEPVTTPADGCGAPETRESTGVDRRWGSAMLLRLTRRSERRSPTRMEAQ